MRADNIRVVVATDDRLKRMAYDIRRRVFVEEQGVPESIEMDDDDARALHVVAFAGERAVGCARMVPHRDYGKIGRMAVEMKWRGKGVGLQLIDFMLHSARTQGFRRVVLHAQTHAEGFYRKAGFTPVGPEFDEAGIPHRRMEREL